MMQPISAGKLLMVLREHVETMREQRRKTENEARVREGTFESVGYIRACEEIITLCSTLKYFVEQVPPQVKPDPDTCPF